MIVALTEWNGRVSPVFDVAGSAVIVEIEGHVIKGKRMVTLPGSEVSEKIRFLLNWEVSDLVCGAISCEASMLVISAGLELKSFISGNIDDVILALMNQSIDSSAFFMPGCGRRKKVCGDRRRGSGCGKRGCDGPHCCGT